MTRVANLIVAITLLAAFPLHAADALDRAIERMPDSEKIAQLLMVGFDGTRVSPDLERLVKTWHVGGIVLYKQNVDSAAQVTSLTAAMRSLSAGYVEPFIAIDQEGGIVRRLTEGVPDLPGNMSLGAARSPELARRSGLLTARALRAFGITMNLAPVLDVLSNPENTSLQTRAFSDDPKLVASLGSAFVQGELEGGVIPVAKHFPGEGGSAGNSHFELPHLDASRQVLEKRELVPFRAAIAAGLPAMMSSHDAAPQIAEGKDLPSTLSHRVLTDLLRHDLGFRGLIITDELQMKAIKKDGDPGEIALAAILAGADMVMVVWEHEDREAIYSALEAAYASGRLPSARVHESLRRILQLKQQLSQKREIDPPTAAENDALTADIAAASMTLLLPHAALDPEAVAAPVPYLGRPGPLHDALAPTGWVASPPRVDDGIVQRALASLGKATKLVAAITTDNDRKLTIALQSARPELRVTVVCFGNPRLLDGITNPGNVLFAYSDSKASQVAAAQVLLASKPAPGVLPIAWKPAVTATAPR